MTKRSYTLLALVTFLCTATDVVLCPGRATADTGSAADHQPKRQLWTCGMHPQVVRDQPGTCPICGMQLTPVDPEQAESQSASDAITIEPRIAHNMGLKTAVAEMNILSRRLRLPGVLAEQQPLQAEVNLRVDGWIERLYAASDGQHVERDQPLFELFSPELHVAAKELQAARGTAIESAARTKLATLGVAAADIESIQKSESAPRTFTIRSPLRGHIVAKPVVAGSAVRSGDTVLRIVDHTRLWVEAQVFERQLAWVKLGQQASIEIDAFPGAFITGRISFLHPHVELETRSATLRIEVDNPEMKLKPGMFASVSVEASAGEESLNIPRSAVIDTGLRTFVFVALPGNRYEPRAVRTGIAGDDDRIAILEGLSAGDTVVISGQFLLDSESRIQEAIRRHLAH